MVESEERPRTANVDVEEMMEASMTVVILAYVCELIARGETGREGQWAILHGAFGMSQEQSCRACLKYAPSGPGKYPGDRKRTKRTRNRCTYEETGRGLTRVFVEAEELLQQILGSEAEFLQIQMLPEDSRRHIRRLASDHEDWDGSSSLRGLGLVDEGLDQLETLRGGGARLESLAPGLGRVGLRMGDRRGGFNRERRERCRDRVYRHNGRRGVKESGGRRDCAKGAAVSQRVLVA